MHFCELLGCHKHFSLKSVPRTSLPILDNSGQLRTGFFLPSQYSVRMVRLLAAQSYNVLCPPVIWDKVLGPRSL